MLSVGVDLAVRRIALAIPAEGIVERLKLPAKIELEDCGRHLGRWAVDMLRGYNFARTEMFMERPFMGGSHGNVRTAVSQGIVAGGIIALLRDEGCPVRLIEHPSLWKKGVVGHGNANKERTGEWLAERHPALSEACRFDGKIDEDCVDAVCIGLHGDMGGPLRVQKR